MLSKRLIAVARNRGLPLSKSARICRPLALSSWKLALASPVVSPRAQFHTSSCYYAEETVKVPQMAESLTEGTLKSWLKQPGEAVEADEEVATIETDKIDVPVNAPKSGKIVKHLANEEDTVTVGQDLFVIEPGGVATAPKEESKPAEPSKPTEPSKPVEESKPASAPLEPPKEEFEPAPAPEAAAPSKPAPQSMAPKKSDSGARPAPPPGSRGETRVKMSRMRLRIAERLKESQSTAASLTTFNEIDMFSLMEMRKKYKDQILKERDVKLGFMSAFVKACTLTIKDIPAANASIEGDEMVYRDYVDLSVAVATPKGLVTPVVRNAQQMSFIEIEKEIVALGKKARDGKLTLEDMAGGTFTISNGGVFGSLFGTPIINLPQAAVFGMHAIKEKPVVVNGQIVIRPIMVVALTYDHRVLDGREAVTFLVKVRDYIEDPRKMLLA